MRALSPRVPSVTLPLYVVHGMKDLTTSFDAVDDFVKRAGSTDVTFNKVQGACRGEEGAHARFAWHGPCRGRVRAPVPRSRRRCTRPPPAHADGLHELLMGDERTANGTAIADWVKARCAAAARAKGAAPASPKL
jgi:hypothetical protein